MFSQSKSQEGRTYMLCNIVVYPLMLIVCQKGNCEQSLGKLLMCWQTLLTCWWTDKVGVDGYFFGNPQVQSRFILDIVVHQSPPILQPLVIEKQQLLSRKDAFKLLDLSLDISDSIRALHLKPDDNIGHPVLNGDLHNENASKKKHFKPICARKQSQEWKGQNKLTLIARAGYFSQFCEVGGLATLNKRKKTNLAGNILESLLSFREL